jgi:hypothetical protein
MSTLSPRWPLLLLSVLLFACNINIGHFFGAPYVLSPAEEQQYLNNLSTADAKLALTLEAVKQSDLATERAKVEATLNALESPTPTATQASGAPGGGAANPPAGSSLFPSITGTWNSTSGSGAASVWVLKQEPAAGNQPAPVTGYGDFGGAQAPIKNGLYDPATGALTFSIYQTFLSSDETFALQVSADGKTLSGDAGITGVGSWPWVMTR